MPAATLSFPCPNQHTIDTLHTLPPGHCLQGEPLDLFAAEEPPAEYSRVHVEGVFDHARSQFVGPRTRQIAGNSKQAGFPHSVPAACCRCT